MTLDQWLASHPYIQPIADFHALVKAAAINLQIASVCLPNWENYSKDYQVGVPMLRSSEVTIDFEPAGAAVLSLVGKLASQPLPEKLAAENRDLKKQLRSELKAPHQAIDWLLNEEVFRPAHPGLFRYLGWTVLARYLRPLLKAFNRWRDEDRWLCNYCPACGSPPAMSQLVGVDPGRRRLLSCGCCGTRWRFRRIGCPFCLKDDAHRLAILAIEGEKDLRIDYCESCGAYLKTYVGEGSEAFFLADWTSLHLDLLANDRGLKRPVASLYQL